MCLSKRNENRACVVGSLLIILMIALSGCAGANYGKLESRKSVGQAFQSNQILPNHKYYFAGVYSKPTVIFGINQNYELTDRMWTEIDPKSDDFSVIIDRVMLYGTTDYVSQAWGFVILDPEGKEAGVWYSAIRSAAVRVNEKGQIDQLSPMRHRAIGAQ